MYGNTRPFSYSPGGFSADDLQQHRRALQQDDHRSSSLQRNNMSRPSGKSIYMQRKEYSEELNRKPDNLHVRVEHLFTCVLDGQEVKTVEGCVAKLKRLDAKGRIWSQEMIMGVQGGHLLLSDIETKAELEVLPLSSITQTTAVLDSCAYNSLLAITVKERSKGLSQVFLFQCEETGAELIKSDLDKAVQRGGVDEEPRREPPDIRSDLENIIGQYAPGSPRHPGKRPGHREWSPAPPPDTPSPVWSSREPEMILPPRSYTPRDSMDAPDINDSIFRQEAPYSSGPTDTERNAEILNHVINDLELFMEKVSNAVNAESVKVDMSKKKNGFLKKKKTKGPIVKLPSWEEYTSYLQKIKYGFNLLGQLEESLTSPTAPEYVHIFFNSLSMILPHYPEDLAPTVLSPLLTVAALRLLSLVVTPEEDELWKNLGDAWNIPRSRWPNDDIPMYIPEFYDGWQPPPLSNMASPPPYQNGVMSRGNSQRFPPSQEPVSNGPWNSSRPQSTEPPLYMRVIYDFMARNNRELSVMKGDEVQVVQKSKQWWLVRNSRNEEGNVPQNVLEPLGSGGPMRDIPRDMRGAMTLDMTSSPPQVRAWLESKGFSNITVSSLGVLNGKMLLEMRENDIKTVCPEEGGRVFFQLQSVKSAIALASEPSGRYNGRF